MDENYDVHLGRFIEVCTEEKERKQSRISRLLNLPKGSVRHTSGASDGTRGYDVYCFGKVLLELVTGHPVSRYYSNFGVMGWMDNVLSHITTHDKGLFVNVMDPFLTWDEVVLNQVWTVAVIAKACLSLKPSKRPQMTNVLKALEKHSLEELSTDIQPPSNGQLTVVAEGLLEKLRLAEGYEVEGTSPAVTDEYSSDSYAAPWNNQFSPASGTEEAYRNGEIWDLPNLTVFRYEELQEATRWFRVDNLVDEFGKEYRGRLPNKSTSKIGSESIVVKLFRRDHFGGFEGLLFGHQYWRTEIQILGRLSHPHFIKLHGYCHQDDTLFLVYEYMPKGCLDNHVFLRGYDKLSWGTRLKILIGAARGLAYLHALKRGVIFRDFNIKSILLDASYNAKLRNFGLATIGPPENETHVTSPVVGTSGYGAPEYMATGHLSVKCDVYSFGVVMLEVLTGLRWVDYNRPKGEEQLINRIKPLSSRGKIHAIIDPRLEDSYPLKAAGEMAKLALTCLSSQPKARPTMKEVVEILERIETSQEF